MRGIAASGVRVYGARGPVKTRSHGPVSTMRPSLMTATRCAMRRTTARSWAMKRYAKPLSR